MIEKFYEIKEFLLSKKYYIICIFIIVCLLILLFVFNNKKDDNKELSNIKLEKEEEKVSVSNNDDCLVKVDIKGYINNPGLYEVSCDNRVNDVINLAGGLKENSDISIINLSKKVKDEMVIVIYSKDEVNDFLNTRENEKIIEDKCSNNTLKNDACITSSERIETSVSIKEKNNNVNNTNTNTNSSNSNSLISINTASKDELMTLSGIGESKAISIIKYREENGLFKSIEDIKSVTGIGDKMFEKIKDYITV